jgi:hypothetical protein
MNMKIDPKIASSIKNLHDILQILAEDFKVISGYIDENPTNFWFRTYIRSFFAMVEGTSFALKQLALDEHMIKPCFTQAEIALLREVSYELNRQGDEIIKTKRLDTLANVRFTFKSIIKAFKLDVIIEYDDGGWNSFREALKIRHQITHPKLISELQIADNKDNKGDKQHIISEAAEWYTEKIERICKGLNVTLLDK